MRIDFLYFEECPSHGPALERLRKVMAEEGVEFEVSIVEVRTEEQAQDLEFAGSPTILVEGRDISPHPGLPNYALTCRIYHLEDGRISPLPSEHMIRRATRAVADRAGFPTPRYNVRQVLYGAAVGERSVGWRRTSSGCRALPTRAS